jgi:RNA polymerase sigma factor (sigma-70 family)
MGIRLVREFFTEPFAPPGQVDSDMALDRARLNALMDQASSANDVAFGALASAVQDELFRLALALGLQREDAAEAVQEVLLRAYAGRTAWKVGSDALAWLCGFAVNVVRECHRRARRRVRPRAPEGRGPDGLLAGGRTVAEDGFTADQLQQLMEAVAELPPRQREAIACRYLRRMSIRETAVVMGCAEGTVKSAVAAALERLRRLLEKQR